MASASDLAEALLPLREAGIRLRTVTTPAVALGSLARMRRAISVPDAIESYVALDEQVTCIALVRNGVLLAARDLPWGFIDADYARMAGRDRAKTSRRGWPGRSANSSRRLADRRETSGRSASAAGYPSCAACR